MAGMRVVVVKAADDGAVDLDDLRAQCEKHADDLAAIMVTYPSTHGAYEDTHHRALRDRARARRPGVRRRRQPQRAARATPSPASSAATSRTSTCTRRSASRTAAAVPGVGPVGGARAPRAVPALAPDAPRRRRSARASAPISAAPYGSAGILPISWAYIRMMGADGPDRRRPRSRCCRPTTSPRGSASTSRCSTRATAAWSPTSASSTCAALTKATGVTVDDVAKRLVDYGFHAPTMRFPVAGHADGRADRVRGPRRDRPVLRRDDRDPRRDRPGRARGSGAPRSRRCAARRTPSRALVGEWDRAYSRELAVFPTGSDPDKYWPPVARIDQAYGDRNLVCSCPPPEAFAE